MRRILKAGCRVTSGNILSLDKNGTGKRSATVWESYSQWVAHNGGLYSIKEEQSLAERRPYALQMCWNYRDTTHANNNSLDSIRWLWMQGFLQESCQRIDRMFIAESSKKMNMGKSVLDNRNACNYSQCRIFIKNMRHDIVHC